jgi:SAM-dependent methyltransferase
MPMHNSRDWAFSLLRCPRCGSTLRWAAENRVHCNGDRGPCDGQRGFPLIHGQPALVVFERSVLDEAAFVQSDAGSLVRRSKPGGGVRRAARKMLALLEGGNRAAAANCRRFLAELHAMRGDCPDFRAGDCPDFRASENGTVPLSSTPIVLTVGGAVVGSGVEGLYAGGGDCPDSRANENGTVPFSSVRVLCFDVYASPETDFIADAHDIPLADGSVDGVWIQAVLEHVIEPERVVAELHRVLKPGGIVYAEIPFMQTVHEGAYDFTRWTDTGIRWLFRRFKRIDSGVVLGPGHALLWSLRAWLSGLVRSRTVGRLIAAPFFWVRFFDGLIPRRFAIDAACGLYFLGRKAAEPIGPKDAIAAFQGVRA